MNSPEALVRVAEIAANAYRYKATLDNICCTIALLGSVALLCFLVIKAMRIANS